MIDKRRHKKVLIVFPEIHLPYAPTVINLFNELKKHFDVSLIAPRPESWYSSQKIDNPNIQYFETKEIHLSLITKIISKIRDKLNRPSVKMLDIRTLHTAKTKVLINKIKYFSGEIIAVDFMALWSAQQAGKKAHFVSLEILEKDQYKRYCNLSLIQSIIIQSIERLNYLFPKIHAKAFLVQNAPPYYEFNPILNKRKTNNLLFVAALSLGLALYRVSSLFKIILNIL